MAFSGDDFGSPDNGEGGGAVAPAAITQDLSAGTKTDTGSMQGGSTSLGASSDLALAAGVHGKWDGGMDGYAILQAIPTVPTEGQTLRVVMTCASVSGDPGGSNVSLGIMLSPDTSPASTEGYFAGGFIRTGASANKAMVPDRLGDGFGGTTTLVGALTVVAEFPWGPSAPMSCNTNVFGADSGSQFSANQTGNSGTWGAPCVGICMQNINSSGGAEVVWSTVVVTIEVVG
jgi:hypothetical protein|tara:strand:+ start:1400 stop:2092 length:693 start_codon:yes stop_codon:yes gene_type:complete